MDICGIGVIFLSRSYFWGNAPQFFVGDKNPKLYNGAYRHFLLCFLNCQKPANGDRGNILGIYVAQLVLANAHLGFWGTLPIFLQGSKNLNFWQNFRQHSELAAYYSKTERYMENLKQQGSSLIIWLYSPQIWWGSAEQSRRNVYANRGGAGYC